MNSGNMALETAFGIAMTIFPIVLAVMVFMCLIRAVKGPRIADRIVAVNMMGTMTMVIIAILAVTLLTKVYMGVYAERKKKKEESHDSTAVD